MGPPAPTRCGRPARLAQLRGPARCENLLITHAPPSIVSIIGSPPRETLVAMAKAIAPRL